MERRAAAAAAAAFTVAVGVYLWHRRRRLGLTDAATREASDAQPSLTDVGDEASFAEPNNILLILSGVEGVADLAADFFGTVMFHVPMRADTPFDKKHVFLVGDCSKAPVVELVAADRVFVVAELSHSIESQHFESVGLGKVPIRVHGVGVYYRRFFDFEGDSFFHRVQAEHAFQSLKEGTKPGTAHRTGIYLTPVVEMEDDEAHFRLLRCSTNFSGATEGFGASDTLIVDALNREARTLFGGSQAPLNHVLAQIYHNSAAADGHKQFKAAIKGHSDKTKDMPTNAIMAFVTFYDESSLARLEPLAADPFDYGVRKSGSSGLTRLHFRLKPAAAKAYNGRLPPQFSVTLYPNSVFFMPLSTNRLFTHEIRPGVLDAALLPTRMGYVVRCSSAEAVHREGYTFLRRSDGRLVPLQRSTPEEVHELRALYKAENASIEPVTYGSRFLFSMNEGDYMRPTLAAISSSTPVVHVTSPPLPASAPSAPSAASAPSAPTAPASAALGAPPPHSFRSIALPGGSRGSSNPFEELLAPVRFESVTKGRRGAVLVQPDAARGCPIVRTTTKYAEPAQCFAPAHVRLAERVQASAALLAPLNNALIEVYTNAYAKMGAHSDQAQDLLPGTAIALFSCYRHPPSRATPPPRKLVVQSKEAGGGGGFEIPLAHNTVVIWSLETNQRFRHKIVLETAARPSDNEWLGVTFRTSKTYVVSRAHDEDGPVHTIFEDGTQLTLATDAQAKELYQLRGRENAEMDFTYPSLPYTISPSDILPPTASCHHLG